jgi:hypothetical protein
MAAVIPEAAEAVTTGRAAVTAAAAPPRRAPAPAAAPAPAGPRRAPAGKRRQAPRRAARIPGARVPGGRNYQPVILAEFLAAVLVVALAPIAKGGTSTAQAKGSPSPYDTSTLKQILLIGVAYFILALASSGKQLGRFSAWFGGLILVTIGIQQTVNGGFAAVLDMFGLKVGSGLGTFPASGDSGSLLPSLNLNTGQFSGDALAEGVSAGPSLPGSPPTIPAVTAEPVSNATGIFPTVEPGGSITSSVVTNGLPPSVNLA